MIEPAHGSVLTSPEALDLLVREESIGRHLTGLPDPDHPSEVLDNSLSPSQCATEIRAHIKPVPPDRLEVKECVERRHALDIAGIELQRAGHLAHRLGREMAELLLGKVEGGHHRRARLRVPGRQGFDLFEKMGGQRAHLSTSPSTVSAVPMMAIMSATKWLSAMRSSACRLTKDAERNFTRRGLCVPSLTM